MRQHKCGYCLRMYCKDSLMRKNKAIVFSFLLRPIPKFSVYVYVIHKNQNIKLTSLKKGWKSRENKSTTHYTKCLLLKLLNVIQDQIPKFHCKAHHASQNYHNSGRCCLFSELFIFRGI